MWKFEKRIVLLLWSEVDGWKDESHIVCVNSCGWSEIINFFRFRLSQLVQLSVQICMFVSSILLNECWRRMRGSPSAEHFLTRTFFFFHSLSFLLKTWKKLEERRRICIARRENKRRIGTQTIKWWGMGSWPEGDLCVRFCFPSRFCFKKEEMFRRNIQRKKDGDCRLKTRGEDWKVLHLKILPSYAMLCHVMDHSSYSFPTSW